MSLLFVSGTTSESVLDFFVVGFSVTGSDVLFRFLPLLAAAGMMCVSYDVTYREREI